MERRRTQRRGTAKSSAISPVPPATKGTGRKLLRAIDRALAKMPQHGQELPPLEDMLADLGFVPLPH